MRLGALLAWLSLLLCGTVVAAPLRVMSISMCSDDLLLDLLPAERITSLTYYARARGNLKWWPQSAHIASNAGTAEEVLAQHPDLVLAGTYTTPATRAMLKRAGVPLLEVPPAESFEQITAVTRQVAAVLGVEQRGEALLADMERTLAAVRSTRAQFPARVVAWGEGGAVPGRDTLFDAILAAAGGINIAAAAGFRSFDLEQLLNAAPDVLAYASSVDDSPSLNTELTHHRVLRQMYADRTITYPAALYSCGVPRSAEAAVALQAQLAAVMRVR